MNSISIVIVTFAVWFTLSMIFYAVFSDKLKNKLEKKYNITIKTGYRGGWYTDDNNSKIKNKITLFPVYIYGGIFIVTLVIVYLISFLF